MTPEHIYFITLLRHGESEGNIRNLFQGQKDYPLTKHGKEQALSLAKEWQKKGLLFDKIISSPLSRAYKTAQIIGEVLGLLVETDSIWLEQDFGFLSDLDITEYYNNPENSSFLNPYQPMGKFGESRISLYTRGMEAVQSILKLQPGRYLVATHGSLLNMVLYGILGITPHPDIQGPRFRFGNTAYMDLEYYPDKHRWILSNLCNPK